MWSSRSNKSSKIGLCCFVMPQMLLNPVLRHITALPVLSQHSSHVRNTEARRHHHTDWALTHLLSFCVECCAISDARPPAFCPSVYIHASLPAARCCCCLPSFPLLSFSVFAIALLLHCPPAGCMQAMQHTHTLTQTHTASAAVSYLPQMPGE